MNPASPPIFRVLVPIEFGPNIERQFDVLAALAKTVKLDATLIHVVAPRLFPDDEGSPAGNMPEGVRVLLDRYLRRLDRKLTGMGASTRGLLLAGDPLDIVEQQAVHDNVDCILVGGGSHPQMHQVLIGSFLWNLLKEKVAPVLFVGPETRVPEEGFRNIVTGIDFGPRTVGLLHQSAEFASHLKCRLHLHHANSIPCLDVQGANSENEHIRLKDLPDVILANARQRLLQEARSVQSIVPDTIHVSARHAEARDSLPETGEHLGNSMIAVGSQGHGLAYELILGSTASKLLRDGRLPVLILPLRKRASFEEPSANKNQDRLNPLAAMASSRQSFP